MAALAEEYGVAQVTIRKTLIRHDEPRRRRGGIGRQWTPEEMSEARRRYEAGESQEKIARSFGCSQGTVGRMLRAQGVMSLKRVGEKHGAWKGGRISLNGKYVGVWMPADSPFAAMRNSIGYVAEHRLHMAQALGRPLERHETVHHINGDTRDNRLGNLQLRQGQHGHGIVMRCDDCGSDNVRPYELD